MFKAFASVERLFLRTSAMHSDLPSNYQYQDSSSSSNPIFPCKDLNSKSCWGFFNRVSDPVSDEPDPVSDEPDPVSDGPDPVSDEPDPVSDESDINKSTVCPRSSAPFYIVAHYIKGSLRLGQTVRWFFFSRAKLFKKRQIRIGPKYPDPKLWLFSGPQGRISF